MELTFEYKKPLINKILVVVMLTIGNRARGGTRKCRRIF